MSNEEGMRQCGGKRIYIFEYGIRSEDKTNKKHNESELMATALIYKHI
jgi:hypothetical protein